MRDFEYAAVLSGIDMDGKDAELVVTEAGIAYT